MWKYSYLDLAFQQQLVYGERDTRFLSVDAQLSTGHSADGALTGGTNTSSQGDSMDDAMASDSCRQDRVQPKYNHLGSDPGTGLPLFVERPS